MSTTCKVIITCASLTVVGAALCEFKINILGIAMASLGVVGLMAAPAIADAINGNDK